MLKISLYQNFCGCWCVIEMNHNKYDYRKNQSYTTDRQATSATCRGLSPRQEARISYALPRNTAKSQWSDLQRSWDTDRNDTYIRQLLGETVRKRRHQRSGDTPRTGTQTNHGLFRRGSRTPCYRERQSVMKAKEAWQQASCKEASESTFRAFLSALARDIDV